MKKDFRRDSLMFKNDNFLKALEESSKRSRSLLLLLIFTSLFVLMALVNSFPVEYNWFRSKNEMLFDIEKYLVLPADSNYSDSTNYSSVLKYAQANEDLFFKSDSIVHRSLNESFGPQPNVAFPIKIVSPQKASVRVDPSFSKRLLKYKEIELAIEYVQKHAITEKGYIKKLNEKYIEALVEHIELVRVPILGISFHINYLGVYSGGILLVLYLLLYFSLYREKVNLKMIFHESNRGKKSDHYYTYEYASMSQVLSLPKKLFFDDFKSNKLYNSVSVIGLRLPFIIYCGLLVYDIYSMKFGFESNRSLTMVTIGFDIVLCFGTWIVLRRVKKMWGDIDKIFNDHLYSLNFEYIFEALGDDTEIDLLSYREKKLNTSHRNGIMNLWHASIASPSSVNEYLKSKNPEKFIEDFLGKTLTAEDIPNQSEQADNSVRCSWKRFRNWFYDKGRNHGDFSFLDSFTSFLKEEKNKHSV